MKGTKLLWAIVIGLIIGAILTSGSTMAVFTSAYSSKPCSVKFDFENSTDGWIPATIDPNNPSYNQAITRVNRSRDQAFSGEYSLKIDVDIAYKDEHKEKGETLVMYTGNLKGKEIKAYVYCPAGSEWDAPLLVYN